VHDLDLEVGVAPGRTGDLEVSVRSEFGQASAPFQLRSDEGDLIGRQRALRTLVRATSSSGGASTSGEHAIEALGGDLFDSLFPDGPVRERFEAERDRAEERGGGLRIRLSIDAPEIAALPWEYLRDPKRLDFLGLAAATTLITFISTPREIRPLTVRPPLRILGLIASSSDRPGLEIDRERQRLEDALWKPASGGQIALETLSNGTWRELQSALRDGPWHIFHLIAGGGYDTEHGEGFVHLLDETGRPSRLSASGLGRMLGDHRAMRLAILDMSEAARDDAIDSLSRTASTLVRRGTPGVVAIPGGVSDRAKVEFDRAFYSAIAEGTPVHHAISLARRSIAAAIEGSPEWGAPVLYASADDGVLYKIESRPPPDESIARPAVMSPGPVMTPPAAGASAVAAPMTSRGSAPGDLGSDTLSAAQVASRRSGAKPRLRGATEGPSMAGGTRTGPPKLMDAILHGGYISALVGAEIGALLAMIAVPILKDQGIIEGIAGFWPEQDLSWVKEGAVWIGLWVGIVGGTYTTLRLFRAVDRSWTIGIVAILTLFLIGAVLAPEFQWLAYGDPATLEQIGQRVGFAVIGIVFVARGITRFARNGTL
jgi:hypothetical protein